MNLAASEQQALRYAQRSNDKLRHRKQQQTEITAPLRQPSFQESGDCVCI